MSREITGPPGGSGVFPGFFLDSVFSRLAGTFNVGVEEWGRRCWTVFYVRPGDR